MNTLYWFLASAVHLLAFPALLATVVSVFLFIGWSMAMIAEMIL